MKRKTFYANVDVDVDYDIEFRDLLDLISSCDEEEIDIIRKQIGTESEDNFDVETLYDEQKLEILIQAYKKYTLEELQEIIKI